MSEVIVCSDVAHISKSGITLKTRESKQIYVCFDECIKNYVEEGGAKTSRCVASRDITKLSFTFYSIPKTKIIFKKSFPMDLILRKAARKKFLNLQKQISKFGYSSYDLS